MSRWPRVPIWLPVLAAGLLVVRLSEADDRPKKPQTVEEQLRTMQRRLDQLEAERDGLTKRADDAEAGLKQLRADLATAKQAVASLGSQALLDRVPVGTMLPYFGSELPRGYAWADGQTNFPNTPAVPKHLRLKSVPDMREHLVGGAKDESNVGLVYDQGLLTLPEVTIRGASFKLPKDRKEEIRIGAGEGYCEEGAWAMQFRNTNPKENTGFGHRYCGAFGGEFYGTPAVYRSFKTGEALEGEQKIPAVVFALNSAQTNPRHVMCRWVVRTE